MKAFLLSLMLTGSACAETLVIPVQDLLFDIPQFTNAPQFNLGGALQGQWTPETPKRTDRPTQRQLEKKLINMPRLLRLQFPINRLLSQLKLFFSKNFA